MPELPHADVEGTSIVLVGAFNPRIFHPAWFVRNQLLAAGIEADSNVEIVNNDLCAFKTDWFRLEVLSDRLVIGSLATPAPETLRDLLLGTFRILRHTPVQKVGLNTHTHIGFPSAERWNEFGHSLAPKKVLWDDVLVHPGTASLIIQGERPDKYDGHIRVKIEPSVRVEHGVFFETNDEYRQMDASSADWIEDVLTGEWDASRRRADSIRNHVLGKGYYGDLG